MRARKGSFDIALTAGVVGDKDDTNGAARYTDYSLSGSVTTWKLGLTYEPFRDLRLRGVRSRDIRAPMPSPLSRTQLLW